MMDERQFAKIRSYVESHYVNVRQTVSFQQSRKTGKKPKRTFEQQDNKQEKTSSSTDSDIDKIVAIYTNSHGETLYQMLDRLMKAQSLTPTELSEKARIDKRIISSIKHKPAYRPHTDTLAYIALALHLSLVDTNELLKCAGRAFTNTDVFDVVASACIENGIYDIDTFEEALDRCSNPHSSN